MNGCKHRNGMKCNLFSNDWAEARCRIKNEKDCPYLDPVDFTNADRIRAMTDEELARVIARNAGRYCDDKDPEDEEYERILPWLKSPVEVDE